MLVAILNKSLIITGFVGLMMLVIEYINVLTRGTWQNSLTNHKWTQYFMAVLLGASPGCLGAFAVVAMYSHRVVSLGALVAAMIATSGDEAFVMLALFPGKALMLTVILAAVGLVVGWLTDASITRKVSIASCCEDLRVHNAQTCQCLQRNEIVAQWQHVSLARGALAGMLLLFTYGIAISLIGPETWDWKRVTMISTAAVGLFIVATVPEHFLENHLWQHVVRQHVVRVFLWTFGALAVTYLLINQLQLEGLIQKNVHLVTVIACLVGIIPESGPHLLFVTLYAQGAIPFAVLLSSSIVQDGHGMLPLLAHSRKVFLLVKGMNFGVGLLVGLLVLLGGGP